MPRVCGNRRKRDHHPRWQSPVPGSLNLPEVWNWVIILVAASNIPDPWLAGRSSQMLWPLFVPVAACSLARVWGIHPQNDMPSRFCSSASGS
jgi:hypothetical protein